MKRGRTELTLLLNNVSCCCVSFSLQMPTYEYSSSSLILFSDIIISIWTVFNSFCLHEYIQNNVKDSMRFSRSVALLTIIILRVCLCERVCVCVFVEWGGKWEYNLPLRCANLFSWTQPEKMVVCNLLGLRISCRVNVQSNKRARERERGEGGRTSTKKREAQTEWEEKSRESAKRGRRKQ